MKKQKFFVVVRDFSAEKVEDQFVFETFYAKDKDVAWDLVELNLLNSNKQAWLLTQQELEALKKIL